MAMGALWLVLAGCGEETEIAVYDAPKEPPGSREISPFVQRVLDGGPPTVPADPNGMARQPVAAGPAIRADWLLPDGWSSIAPAPPPSAYAFAVPGTAASAEPLTVTVTALPGEGGGLLPNVNRWRRQLGLPPVASASEMALSLLEMTRAAPTADNPTQAPGVIQAIYVDLLADDQTTRTIAAIWPDPSRQATWFFKLTGDADAVADAAPAFQRFVASTQPTDATPDPP